MNRLNANIKQIQKEGDVAYIKLDSSGYIFSALILDFNNDIAINMPCDVLFKESEVMIADKAYTNISARNNFISPIIEISQDNIFARVAFSFNNTTIYSLITKEAKDKLGLAVGKEFRWFVKSNEVVLDFKK